MDKLASAGDARKGQKAFRFPSPALSGDNLDFSFSGVKTAALNILNADAQKGIETDRELFASSFVNVITSAVADKLGMAVRASGVKSVVMAGGVAANSHLRAKVSAVCSKLGVEFYVPPISLCGDNAAMVASQGVYEYIAGNFADTYMNASAEDD